MHIYTIGNNSSPGVPTVYFINNRQCINGLRKYVFLCWTKSIKGPQAVFVTFPIYMVDSPQVLTRI